MVYFIKSETTGLIKIGYTRDGRLSERLKELSMGHPGVLCVLSSIPVVGVVYEKSLHKRFRYLRVKNEWFSPGEELLKFINPELYEKSLFKSLHGKVRIIYKDGVSQESVDKSIMPVDTRGLIG